MKCKLTILIVQIGMTILNSQPNCLVFEKGDCRTACELAVEASNFQGAKHSQEMFDEAIQLCPSFAYAYYEKSVPYLKHGLILEWKELIDKAVEYDPHNYLLNRGCNQIQFFKNYEAGLKDLDRLYELMGRFEIGHTNSGEYDVQLIRAIACRKIGDVEKSIEIIEELLDSDQYFQNMYDYFHIGITYLEANLLEKAEAAFVKQIEYNEFAEIYYYYSIVFQKLNQNNMAIEMLSRGIELYKKDIIMKNNYYHHLDKVFYSELVDKYNLANK